MGQIGYFFNIIFTYPIFNVLMLLDHVFGDFGLSVIVLTLIVRLCLFPLTLKQLRSTKATQAIQPLMADMKKKYTDDTRAQYAETQQDCTKNTTSIPWQAVCLCWFSCLSSTGCFTP